MMVTFLLKCRGFHVSGRCGGPKPEKKIHSGSSTYVQTQCMLLSGLLCRAELVVCPFSRDTTNLGAEFSP